MPQRVFCFVVVLLLFFNGEIIGQQTLKIKRPVSNPLFTESSLPGRSYFNYSISGQLNRQNNPVVSLGTFSYRLLRPVPANFYSRGLGFFCKQELTIEKTISIPFRFRLGSLDHVNYLEQKPNAIKPGSF